MIPLRDEIFIRGNGDRVAFSEYGDVSGEPVMFCHGWPSSRIMAQFIDDAARELGVRIISPDRPGIAGSSFAVNRKLLDWPPLVSELADFFAPGKISRARDFRRSTVRLRSGVGAAGAGAHGRSGERRA